MVHRVALGYKNLNPLKKFQVWTKKNSREILATDNISAIDFAWPVQKNKKTLRGTQGAGGGVGYRYIALPEISQKSC